MAGGNLGDLWFQLGVKDNTSKELQKIIDKLKTGDDAANSLLRALQGFGTKKSGFKEQAEKAKEFADVLNEINRRISKLKKNDKSDEAKDLQMAVKNARKLSDELGYVLPVDEAMDNLSEELKSNDSIMLSDEKLKTMYFMQPTPAKTTKDIRLSIATRYIIIDLSNAGWPSLYRQTRRIDYRKDYCI